MIITPEHWQYLYIQRGEVASTIVNGLAAWQQAYEDSLVKIMESISPHLPAKVDQILDVGGGMGGIGVMLTQRYPSAGYRVLDGFDDDPKVYRHAATFNNAGVAADFLAANGVKDFGFYAPTRPLDRKFDLVVSFAAWGFHFPPSEYLEKVREALNPGATIILDVRTRRLDWLNQFQDAFGTCDIIEVGKKHSRIVWQT